MNWKTSRPDLPYSAIFLFRFLTLAIACFLPLSDPHTHRQTDTLGISLRYWNRWMQGGDESGWLRLLPAALNSGDGFGYVITEAPLLNLLAAPCFALGPYWGSVAARLLLLSCVFGLLWLCYLRWGNTQIYGVSVRRVALFVPLWSIGAFFVGKHIPDVLAMAAVFAALAFSWNRKAFWPSFALASLGLLMKPTSVVVLAWILLHPRVKDWRNWMWVFASLGVAALYYAGAVPALLIYQDTLFPFHVAARSPIHSLAQFLSDTKGIFNLFTRHYFYQGGTAVLILAWIWQRGRVSTPGLKVCAVLVLQTLLIALLDGTHALQHLYYFAGVAPTVCLIVLHFLESKRVPRWLRLAQWVVLVLALVKITGKEWQVVEPTEVHTQRFARSCARLKQRNPEFPWGREHRFRSDREQYPTLGMCFGERSAASQGEYGFYGSLRSIPEDCALVDREGSLVLVHCRGTAD